MERSIRNIYTPNPLTVTPNTILHECISLMRERQISCLIVCDESKKPVGIYTEADMIRSLNRELDYHAVQIQDLMSAPLITAPASINIFEATYILAQNHIRHLIITHSGGELAGILTQTDIIAHYGEDYFTSAKYVDHVMTKRILMVTPSQIVHEVIAQMEHCTSGCAIAVENGHPVGILTERDMASLIINQANINQLTMADVMSSPVLTIPVHTSTFDAVTLMNRRKVQRLIVIDEKNEIVGTLIQEDIVRNLESNYVQFLKDILVQQNNKLIEAQQELQEQANQLENLLNSSLGMSIIVADLSFKVVYLNHDCCLMFNVDKGQMIQQPLERILQTDSVNEHSISKIKEDIETKGVYWFIHLRTSNQCLHHIESRLSPIFVQGKLTGYSLVSQDITNKLHTERRLLLATHVFECAIEGIMVTDVKGSIQLVNQAFTDITGYSSAEVIGKNPRILQSNRQPPSFYHEMWGILKATGRWQGEIWNRRKSGEVYPEHLTISSVKDLNGEVIQYTALFYDITEMKEKEERIHHRAYHDPLTELPNRLLFKDRLNQAIIRARRNNEKLAILFIDIDHFKDLNDTQGHQAGDTVLQQISLAFRSLLRDQDTISRFAGDEFTILLDNCDSLIHATSVAEKILAIFEQPFYVHDTEAFLGASIGIACYPHDGNNADILLKNADTAMYHVKKNGRNTYQTFQPSMEIHLKQRVSLENELRKALQNQKLEIHYQPIISLHDRKITSLEALLRWDKQKNSPKDFIPVAEKSGLIVPIGEWVLRQTCQKLPSFQIDSESGLSISVNLSARQFRGKDLLPCIQRILEETQLNPLQLHLDVTETSIMENMPEAIKTLSALRNLGVSILLDDFGTGYSSLTYLQRLPVDTLKLDHTFIHNIDREYASARLAAGIISMAKDMNLQIVAEGVETEEQLNFLENHGCDMVQGYLFHKALDEKSLHDVLLAQHKPK